ncbi:hypothetical protein [Halomarina oriensis]|uniref:DUF7968 domain-containing protein n=1 Tax=Halomarina oriensis TaxID=671145 RepID=A0A6B0GPK6_9EURY|nr:hypothetical protein [Halomarina oriensis]MWG34593.1 hypothetical protein [Halomarina oriensis]
MITRVVLSHPEALSSWGRQQIATTHFRAWLGRTHDTFEEGEQFEEFADVGCCGDALHIPFVVEAVEGSGEVTRETAVEYVERTGCDFAGGWEVQSRAGPST